MKIAELHDGREFRFPDSMSDSQVDGFVKALIAAENSAARARAEVQALSAKLDAILSAPSKGAAPVINTQMVDVTPVIVELRQMRADLNSGIASMVSAQLADTVLVRDEFGDQTRSKKVL